MCVCICVCLCVTDFKKFFFFVLSFKGSPKRTPFDNLGRLGDPPGNVYQQPRGGTLLQFNLENLGPPNFIWRGFPKSFKAFRIRFAIKSRAPVENPSLVETQLIFDTVKIRKNIFGNKKIRNGTMLLYSWNTIGKSATIFLECSQIMRKYLRWHGSKSCREMSCCYVCIVRIPEFTN